MSLKIKRQKIIIWSLYIITFIIFFVFLFYKSKYGIILGGDNNIILLKNNKYLLNPYLWMDNDYGNFLLLFFIDFPRQIIFKILTIFFNPNFVSDFYYYSSILGLLLANLYLIKKVNQNAEKIDYFVISIYAVLNPLISLQILTQTESIHSLIFITLIIGYLFNCKNKKRMNFFDLFVLAILITLVNSYLHNAILLFVIIILAILFLFTFKLVSISDVMKLKKKVIILALLLLLINLFWITIPAYNFIQGTGITQSVNYSVDNAIDFLNFNTTFVKSFSPFALLTHYTTDSSTITSFYSNKLIIFPSLIFIIFIFFSILIYKNEKIENKKLTYFLLILILIFYIFCMGTNEPFKAVFLFFWNHIPFFNLFRTFYKFQFVLYFSFVILFIFALKKYDGNYKIKVLLLALTIPMIISHFFNPFYEKFKKPYEIPEYYNAFETVSNAKKLVNTYKIFPDTYPGANWTPYEWNTNNYESQNVLPIFTKQNVANTQNNNVSKYISKTLCNKEYYTQRDIAKLTRLLGLLNIKHIIMQNDIYHKKSSCYNPINEYKKESIGKLDIYTINNDDFLPHFYTPENIIISENKVDELPKILSQENYNLRSAIYFKDQNVGKEDKVEDLASLMSLHNNEENLPVLEFKKINPTKYRIIVHGASHKFPLIFSESFHKGWKIYPIKKQESKPDIQKLDKYKILNGNAEDQANKYELGDYIKNNLISDLGDNENIDYISKNFQDTIQNDNLTNGTIYETWLKQPIENTSHLLVNGYANSWLIDTDRICLQTENCHQNLDGSYDFEFVVEFWPQRLFYIGLLISASTLLLCAGYLIIIKLKKRIIKINNEKIN